MTETKEQNSKEQEEKKSFLKAIKQTPIWALIELQLNRMDITEEDFCNRIGNYAQASADKLIELAKQFFPEGPQISALVMAAVLEQMAEASHQQLNEAVVKKLMQNPQIIKKIEEVIGVIAKKVGDNAEAQHVAEMVKGQAVN